MDRTLCRKEAQELMELLGLHMSCWGNVPLIRKKYLMKCKEYHPDKGGDERLMKRLNELYKKLEENVNVVHMENYEEAWNSSQMWWEEFNRAWEQEQIRRDREERKKYYQQSQNSEESGFGSEPGPSQPKEPGPSQHQSQPEPSQPSPRKRPPPPDEPDLNCYENMPDDDPPPQCSQATPPKKKKDENPKFPECLNEFVSHAIFSNRTLTCFIVHTTKEKAILLYKKLLTKFKCTFGSRHNYGSTGMVLIITQGKHRVTAVNNYCKGLCTISFLHCKGVNNPYLCYSRLCEEPFTKVEESVSGGLRENDFRPEDIYGDASENLSWKQVSDYAQVTNQEDIYLLMGHYTQFAADVDDCWLCIDKKVKEHYLYHRMHNHNAKIFVECKNQKNICQQAVDTVIAKKRLLHKHKSRDEQVVMKFKAKLDEMDSRVKSEDDFKLFLGAAAWLSCLFSNIDDKIYKILDILVTNVPKKRYIMFKGPINSGKTTLAAAILDLVGGKALNINVPADKLSFELGCAIDQFMIVFEDVKGIPNSKELPRGQGICNLDNLRDYLDGCVPVNLEKKHMNKRSQIFPPGIVTMNDYYIPPTLQARFTYTLDFVCQKHLYDSLAKTPEIMYGRYLQSGLCILMLLMWYRPVADFTEEIQDKVVYWKECMEKYVSPDDFALMCINVKNGKRIFDDIK
ncbi:large T antigen [Calomys tener polyomavirus]|uniref:large T antigen n=1 Tax=Akodon montensis polyomavirus TaxID=2163422 RepID=UPI000E29AFE0|nr:large T antigen [Akodon montensis polyomavirus]AVY05542.1 large T antigen [Akodon montensis polyomavirus]AVY05547.1 large T antigen [Calomys tener polyomavirus]